MAQSNTALVAKILLISALIFAVMGALSWVGTLPIDPAAHRLFAFSFGICAAVDALIGVILLTRSRNS